MSYKIQSEYQYFLEVTQELQDILGSYVQKFVYHTSSSSQANNKQKQQQQQASSSSVTPTTVINDLPSEENEAIATLLQKCQNYTGRVTKAIAKTQGEILEEWSAIHHLMEGDASTTPEQQQQQQQQQSYVVSSKNRKVVDKAIADLPEKLVDLTELKYKLLQCETAMKNNGSAAIQTYGSHHYFEENFPEFLPKIKAAIRSALDEGMFKAGDHVKCVQIFLTNCGNVDGDVKMTIFHSLMLETLKVLLSHLDKRRKVLLKRAASSSSVSSSASSPNNNNTSNFNNNNNTTASNSAPTTATRMMELDQQQQNENAATNNDSNDVSLGSIRPLAGSTNMIDSSSGSSPSSHFRGEQQQQNHQRHHLYSSAFLPPYNPSMTESQVKEILTNFYTVHAPEYLASVPYLVEEHKTDLGALFEMVSAKYADNGDATTTTSMLPQVSSQPQLTEEEQRNSKPSASPDKTLDDEYSSTSSGGHRGGGRTTSVEANKNTVGTDKNQATEVIQVRIDQNHQKAQSPKLKDGDENKPGFGDGEDSQQQPQQEGNCAIQ